MCHSRFWSVFAAPKEASHSHDSESCASRPETSFLDFWSTSSALYAPHEGPKDAGAAPASFKPSSGHPRLRYFAWVFLEKRLGLNSINISTTADKLCTRTLCPEFLSLCLSRLRLFRSSRFLVVSMAKHAVKNTVQFLKIVW